MLGKGATSTVEKSLFRAANVWWRCAQYFLLPLMAGYIETIDVCIYLFIYIIHISIYGIHVTKQIKLKIQFEY